MRLLWFMLRLVLLPPAFILAACAHLPFAKHTDVQLCKELSHYEQELDENDLIYKRMLCNNFKPDCHDLGQKQCVEKIGCGPLYPPDPICPKGRVCARSERVFLGCEPFARLRRNHFIFWLRCSDQYRQITNCLPRKPRY